MTRMLLTAATAALALSGALLIGPTPSRADANAPFCSYINTLGGGAPRCDFYTYDQCRAAVSGLAGTCSANPAFQGSQARMPARRPAY